AIERVAAIESADQDALDQDAEERDEERRDDETAPEAEIGSYAVGEIGAEREEAAMGEIDDTAEIEDQRQAQGHQGVERANDQPVQDIEQDYLGHRWPSPLKESRASPLRRRAVCERDQLG